MKKFRPLLPVALFLIFAGALLLVGCDLFDSPTAPRPVAGFEVDVNGLVVQVFDASSGADHWSYSWGDGSAPSTQRDALHEYADYGTYIIRQRACRGDDFNDSENCDQAEASVTLLKNIAEP